MGGAATPVEDVARDVIEQDVREDTGGRLGKGARRGKDEEEHRRAVVPMLLVAGVVLAIVVVVVVAVFALGGSGGGDDDRRTSGREPSTEPDREAPTERFFIPGVIDRSSLVPGPPVVSVPSTIDTDPNALSLPADLLAAYQRNGLFLRQTGSLFRLDPAAEATWPAGVEGSLNWGVSHFQTHEGAVAVMRASEANLRAQGFDQLERRALEEQGIAAFEPATSRDGLVNQIWYWVRGNAFLAIASTGRFPPGAERPDEQVLFDTLNRTLRAEQRASGAPFTKTQAADEYSEAVAPVNDAASAFRTRAQTWDAATTNTQATSDAQPLAAALDSVESRMLTIAGRSAPARPAVWPVVVALETLKDDLNDLARLDQIGVTPWLARFEAHITTLTAVSNTLRAALGLEPAGSPSPPP